MSQKKKLTIGILAHVDAGKTSLTESMLYTAGATKNRGSVDKGSAVTDAMVMEKERGISIKTSSVDFEWKETHLTLIDTPGHIDFSAEVDRSLSVLDMVILVISAKEGIQAHTINLWESISERKIPVLVFVNKIDRSGVEVEQVFQDFEKDLKAKLFAINFPIISLPDFPNLVGLKDATPFLKEAIVEKSFENLAELDEEFMEAYLDNSINDLTKVLEKAETQISNRKLIGVLFGSAKLDIGIEELLDIIIQWNPTEKLELVIPSAKVFKVHFDSKLGRLAYIRSYGSTIKSKDVMHSKNLDKEFKINQVYTLSLGNLEQTGVLETGEVGLISSSELLLAGDVLGEDCFSDDFSTLHTPVLSAQVEALEDKDYHKLGESLEVLNIEDPALEFQWLKTEREFHLKILGPIQTEVLKDTLERRFNIKTEFQKPRIIYKETPKKSAEGFVRYWMPKPCWAIMKFIIEPGEPGSGVSFISKVRTSDISNKYLNEVKRAIPWSLKQGIKGWEVTDIKITLVEGTEHTVHSNPGDFLLATPMGVLRGVEAADTNLLEPMYAFEIRADQELLGAISSDLNQMKAQINAPAFEGDTFSISGKVAVAQAMEYSIKFNATTSGKGRLKLSLDGYEKTEFNEEKTRPYQGVSPLNEAQWILHMRGAFKADER